MALTAAIFSAADASASFAASTFVGSVTTTGNPFVGSMSVCPVSTSVLNCGSGRTTSAAMPSAASN
jgi:hypothetical protein